MDRIKPILFTHYHEQDLRWDCKASFFRKFATELRPLIDIRIWFLLKILKMNGQNLTKFCIYIIIDKIYLGIVKRHFLQICNRVPVIDVKHWFLLHILKWMDRI